MRVSVILPAAGLGTRMGRSSPEKFGTSRKQFMLLEGSPILLHTIRRFVASPSVTEIVVALRAEDSEWAAELLRQEGFSKPVRLVSWKQRFEQAGRVYKNDFSRDLRILSGHDRSDTSAEGVTYNDRF